MTAAASGFSSAAEMVFKKNASQKMCFQLVKEFGADTDYVLPEVNGMNRYAGYTGEKFTLYQEIFNVIII